MSAAVITSDSAVAFVRTHGAVHASQFARATGADYADAFAALKAAVDLGEIYLTGDKARVFTVTKPGQRRRAGRR